MGCIFFSNSRIDKKVSLEFKILGAIDKFTCDVNFSVAVKIAAYKEVLVPTLMYSSKFWHWRKKCKSK